MIYSQFLIQRMAAWLADNNSNFQLDILFQKHGYLSQAISGISKYNRALYYLGKITAERDKEQKMKDIFGIIGERINWKMINGQGNKFDRQLVSALRSEGYEIVNGNVIPAPPLNNMTSNVGLLQTAIQEREWQVAEGHLSQALDNFQRGNWAACNSQLRSLLEEIFNAIAKDKFIDEEKAITGGNARKRLEASGIFSKKESEFIQSWFNVLHTSGAHPGLSTQDDTQFRLHITAAMAYWAIRAMHTPNIDAEQT